MFRKVTSLVATMAICLVAVSTRAEKKPLLFMPFSAGSQWYCTQGPGGTYSHKNELYYSYDWNKASGVNNTSNPAFDQPIYSPIRGTVVHVTNWVTDFVDNGASTANNNYGWGNNVIIQDPMTGKYVRILHLKKGSIVVSVGQNVQIGTSLGRLGATGFSSSPHLHIHVQGSSATNKVPTIPINFVENPVISGKWHTSKLTTNASVLDSDGSINLGHGFMATLFASTGTWTPGNWSGSGFTGDDYLYHYNPGTSGKFIWKLKVASPGYYNVFVRWNPASNRDTKAKYTAFGATTYVNQQSGGDWFLLSKPYLGTADYYSITIEGTTPGTYVIADAIMLVKL